MFIHNTNVNINVSVWACLPAPCSSLCCRGRRDLRWEHKPAAVWVRERSVLVRTEMTGNIVVCLFDITVLACLTRNPKYLCESFWQMLVFFSWAIMLAHQRDVLMYGMTNENSCNKGNSVQAHWNITASVLNIVVLSSLCFRNISSKTDLNNSL